MDLDEAAIERERAKGVGEVGIFWFYRGSIQPVSIPHTLGEAYGEFVNGHWDHVTYWPHVKRRLRVKHPEIMNYEYEQVPRGRVIYRESDGRFLIYGSRDFVTDEARKQQVLQAFRIPSEQAVFRADEHYGRVPGMSDAQT